MDHLVGDPGGEANGAEAEAGPLVHLGRKCELGLRAQAELGLPARARDVPVQRHGRPPLIVTVLSCHRPLAGYPAGSGGQSHFAWRRATCS